MSVPNAAAEIRSGARHVVVIGGGASGVLLAAHLLRQNAAEVWVTIIESRGILGCGVAYSTSDPTHLLNTRVANMSAYRHDPDHFLNWLAAKGKLADRFGFVSRATYGHYMAGLLVPWQESGHLRCVASECVRLSESAGGVVAHLANGRVIAGDTAVLATGHSLPDGNANPLVLQPWGQVPVTNGDGHVLIVGSGLTMVDQVLSLLRSGHRGTISAISRRGLLPQVHAPTHPICIPFAQVPIGHIAPLLHWVRERARQHVAAGGDWRDLVDGLRPHLQRIWRNLLPDARRTFLRHGSAWWEVHRHRMAPSSRDAIVAALGSGQLMLSRGAFVGAREGTEGQIIAQIASGRTNAVHEISVARIIDCRGIKRDPEAHATLLFADLLRRGEARIDPLRLGLDVDTDCSLLRRDGSAHSRIHAIGPVSRAAFWEITAIPDIREQVATLALELAAV